MASEELQHALRRVSGTTLDVAGAANVWAGTETGSTNQVTNPRLGVDATGWSATGGTGARVAQGAGWAWQGDGSVVTAMFSPASASTPGQFWSGSVVVSGPSGLLVRALIHDGVSTLTPDQNFVLTGAPQTITLTSTVAVTTGTLPRIYVYPRPLATWTAGQMLTATNALLKVVSGVGVTAGTYFDGSSPGGAWTGAQDASTSTRVATGLELVGALNAKAGTSGLDIDGVANVLAGTPGQGVGINACAALFV